MQQKRKHISELHNEHKEWSSHLALYKEELALWEKHLGEIVSRNTDHEIRALVEKYQNQIIIQNEQIDILSHDVNKHEHVLAADVQANPTASDHRLHEDHDGLRDKFTTFLKLYQDFKHEINLFFAKYF